MNFFLLILALTIGCGFGLIVAPKLFPAWNNSPIRNSIYSPPRTNWFAYLVIVTVNILAAIPCGFLLDNSSASVLLAAVIFFILTQGTAKILNHFRIFFTY